MSTFMNIDLNFAVWCARRCLHFWNPPKDVKAWLVNPKVENAAGTALTAGMAIARSTRAARAARDAAWAAAAVWAARNPAQVAQDAAWAASAPAGVAAEAAEHAAQALDITISQLRLEFVVTWNNDELARASGEWIEPATVEILDRMETRH